MDKKYFVLGGFIVILVLFSLLSSRLFFETWAIELDDSTHYITSAKEIAGISNAKIHNPHSFLYPLYLSSLLTVFPSLITIKLLNLLWLILLGLLIYYETKDLKSLLIYIFSPIVYYSSIWILPLIAVAFFMLLSYFQIRKYEKTNSIKHLLISGFSLGISISLWWGSIPYVLFFALVFLFNKKVKELVYFSIPLFLGMSIAMVIDLYYFNFPFYSLVRFIGAVAIVSLGKNPSNVSFLNPFREQVILRILILLVLISPLLYKIYKLNFKKYRKETIFLVLTSIFAIAYGADIKYFLPIFPFFLILVNEVIKSKKDLNLHMISSIAVIIIVCYPFFFNTLEPKILKDLRDIKSEFKLTKIISGDERKNTLANPAQLNSLYWDDPNLKMIWGSDYERILLNKESSATSYNLKIIPKLNKARLLELSASMNFDTSQDLDAQYQVLGKNEQSLPKFKLVKCYPVLCLYKK